MQKETELDRLIGRTCRFDEVDEGFRLMLSGEAARGVIVFD